MAADLINFFVAAKLKKIKSGCEVEIYPGVKKIFFFQSPGYYFIVQKGRFLPVSLYLKAIPLIVLVFLVVSIWRGLFAKS